MVKSMNIVDIRKNMADAINRVAYRGDRIVLERRGKGVAAIVSMDDLDLLGRLEEEHWTREGLKAEAEIKARGERPIPFERAERELDAARKAKRKSGSRK